MPYRTHLTLITCTLLVALPGAGCQRKSRPNHTKASPTTTSQNPSARLAGKRVRLTLPASTIIAIRERLRPGTASLQTQPALNVGKFATGILFKILEVDPSRGVASVGLRPGGELIAVAHAPQARLLAALKTLKERLKTVDDTEAGRATLDKPLPPVSVEVQLVLPVTDSQRVLDSAASRRFFAQPGLTHWTRGAAPLPAALAALAPLKPDFVATQGNSWVLACWRERPGPRHVLCRLDFPLAPATTPRARQTRLAQVAKRWSRPTPSTPPVRPRFYGDADIATLMNAAGMAAAADLILVRGALRVLRKAKPSERKPGAAYLAATIGLASRFVAEDSDLLTTSLWEIQEKDGVLYGDSRWRMTPKGKRIMAPAVKAVGPQNLFEGTAWADRFVKPLRARLQREAPLRGLYTLKGEELQRLFKLPALATLMPILMLARTWPDMIRMDGIGERFNTFADTFKHQGFRSLRVSIQGDDLVWHMEQPLPGHALRPR